MKLAIASSHRRVNLELTEEGDKVRLKVRFGARFGNTLLDSWAEAESIIIGFVRKLRADEEVSTRQAPQGEKKEVIQPQNPTS